MVCTYEELDPLDPQYKELTRHYVVYELDRDGKKTLYRHFLLQHSGCLVELFEQCTVRLSVRRHFDRMKRLLQFSNDNPHLNGLFGPATDTERLTGADVKNPLHSGGRGLFAGLESA